MANKTKTTIKIIITCLSIGTLYFIFKNKIKDAIGIILEAHMLTIIWALFLFLGVNIFSAIRLKCIFAMHGIHISIFKSFKLNYIGYFFNIFLPSSIGGDIAKGYYAFKYANKKAQSFISVIMDRIIGLFSVVTLCVLSVLLFYKEIKSDLVLFIVGLFFLFALLIFVLFTNRRFSMWFKNIDISFLPKSFMVKLKEIYFLIYECKKHAKYALIAFIASVIFQLISIYCQYLLAVSMGIEIPLMTFYILIPIVYIFSMLPSINGLGVREGAYIYFFSFYIAHEKAIALSLLADVLLYSCSLIGLLFYVMHKEVSIGDLKSSGVNINEFSFKEEEER